MKTISFNRTRSSDKYNNFNAIVFRRDRKVVFSKSMKLIYISKAIKSRI